MKKLYISLFIMFAVVVSIYFYNTIYKNDKIKKAITLQLELTNGQKIDFSKINNIVFDRVCFFGSYTPQEYVTGVLGFDWDVNKETSIGDNDGLSAIVFVKDNTVTAFCEYPLVLNDFEVPLSHCITQKQPILKRKIEKKYNHIWDYDNRNAIRQNNTKPQYLK